MKRLFQGLALASLCLSLAACGAAKYYTLPVDPSLVSQTQTMIGVCATESGLESYKAEDIVTVKYDETATLYYHYQGGDTYQLQVHVDDKVVMGTALEQKQRDARRKGEDLYVCAQARLAPPPPEQVVVVAPPPPTTGTRVNASGTGVSLEMKTDMSPDGMSVSMKTKTSTSTESTESIESTTTVGVGGTCARALECYTQLQRKICEGASDCSFKAEFSGNDDSACRDALRQARETVKQMAPFKPGLTAPAVCQAE
jgi:hypothetical protein